MAVLKPLLLVKLCIKMVRVSNNESFSWCFNVGFNIFKIQIDFMNHTCWGGYGLTPLICCCFYFILQCNALVSYRRLKKKSLLHGTNVTKSKPTNEVKGLHGLPSCLIHNLTTVMLTHHVLVLFPTKRACVVVSLN